LGINYGISNGGDPIIDISNMTRSGSFDFGKNIDVVNAVKDGKAYILGSISQDSAGRVFEIPLKGTKLIIDENSPLRQFFTINNGEVIFNGGAIEVAVKEGVTRNILATATGQNIINNIPIISKVPTILDQVTIHTIPEAIKDLPYRMPPFIPIRGEKPLPYKQADNKIVHQDDKTVIATKGDGKKIVSKDDNITGNQDNKNKVVTAPAPTLDVAGSKVVDDQGKNNIKPIKNNPKENKATPPIENKGGVKDQVKNVVSSSNQELITTIENRKKLFG